MRLPRIATALVRISARLTPLLAAAPAWAGGDLAVARGAVWRYLDDGSDQGTAWHAPGFDDSGWASGPAQLGYGDGDEGTEVSFGPDPDNKYTTTYYRHEFDVVDPSAYAFGLLRLAHDDGAIAYLNGVELQRSNMPFGTVTYTTLASSTVAGAGESAFRPFDFDPGLLTAGTNTLAVEVHQRSLTSSDTSFDLELELSDVPILKRGPYLQHVLQTEAQVRWQTGTASNLLLRWGLAPDALDQSYSLPFATIDHVGFISGLQPSTKYYYSIGSSTDVLAGGDDEHFFVTPPAAGDDTPLRAWVLGDTGTAAPMARQVRDAYLALPESDETDMILLLGDNAYDEGTDIEYQGGIFDTYGEIVRRTVMWPTRGNHDESASTYFGIFSVPTTGQGGGVPSGTELYYSFDAGNVHFISLDSESSSKVVGGPMYNWLESDLLATDQDWIVAFWHHPPYSKGSHDSDDESDLVDMRTNFVPLLEAHGVDLVLSGHSHSYERSYLIDGHHGVESTFSPALHQVDGGDGRPVEDGGDGAYVKVMAPNQGAVYCVAGSSGKLSSTDDVTLDHSAMFLSELLPGSVILEFEGPQLDVRFLDWDGVVIDWFTMLSFPDEGLTAGSVAMSATAGGTQGFALDAGASHGGEAYWMFGSLSGTSPGLPIGGVLLPLNFDAYLALTVNNPTLGFFSGFFSTLAPDGTSSAALTLPAGLVGSLVGLTAHHAFVAFDNLLAGSASFASNPVKLTFLP
ncbi:MAG: metallophosphoesterase family protein [Planctomycetota bacterium]